MLGFDGDAAFALRPHSVTTPGPQGKHEDTSVGSVDVSVRSTPPPSLQGLRRGCLEVRAFWKQSCPVRFHITVCVSPRAHRITPRHMCEAGEIESSQVSGFSNSQLVFWMAASLPGPPLPAANSLQFPEASFDPTPPAPTSGSKVVGGSQGNFRIQVNAQSPCMAPISPRGNPKTSWDLGASPSPLWPFLPHLVPHSVCSSPIHIFHIPWSVDWLLPRLWILFPICLLVKPPQQLQICSHLTFPVDTYTNHPTENCNLFP